MNSEKHKMQTILSQASSMNIMAEETDMSLTLETPVGKINGKVVKMDGKYVGEFLGIPYSKQPIGDRRFKFLEPLDEKLDHKVSPFLAHRKGNSAVQLQQGKFWDTKMPVGEDCIYLNIYTPLGSEPENFQKLSESKLPVLFHIHGGGFKIGSGSEPMYDLSFFAVRHDIVCVNINYRLDMLGFLSYPGVIEDNLGLKDQQVALKWTHENISAFGGDQDRVTIYGCSAGT